MSVSNMFSWPPLGSSWAPVGPSWHPLGSSWALLGHSGSLFPARFCCSRLGTCIFSLWAPYNLLLGFSWAPLGLLLAPHGLLLVSSWLLFLAAGLFPKMILSTSSCALAFLLGSSWALLDPLGLVLGSSWVPLGLPKAAFELSLVLPPASEPS